MTEVCVCVCVDSADVRECSAVRLFETGRNWDNNGCFLDLPSFIQADLLHPLLNEGELVRRHSHFQKGGILRSVSVPQGTARV